MCDSSDPSGDFDRSSCSKTVAEEITGDVVVDDNGHSEACVADMHPSTSLDISAPGVVLQQHSNDNLLKINTHDTFNTVGAVKKYIAKQLPPPTTQEPPLPLFRGMLRIGKNPKNPHIFIAFDTAEHRAEAAAALLTLCYRKQNWVEAPVTARDMQLTYKGKQDPKPHSTGGPDAQPSGSDGRSSNNKRPRDAGEGETAGTLSVNPWANIPLVTQHERKKVHCRDVLCELLAPSRRSHNSTEKARIAALCQSTFEGLLWCEPTEGYRNHVNFSCGRAADGSPVVGFNEGRIVDGNVAVQPCDDRAVTAHPLAKAICLAVQGLIDAFAAQTAGVTTVSDRVTGVGFWRRVQVRHNVHGEVMVCFELDASEPCFPPLSAQNPEALAFASAVAKIVEVLTSKEMTDSLRTVSGLDSARVVSIQYFTHSGTSSVPHEIDRNLLYGSPCLLETLCGLQFEVAPAAFFQVNTPGMELMLRQVKQCATLTPRTTLLDLCCGTGTIGLSLAAHVRRTIGIELVVSAVANARRNAVRNNIQNAEFHDGWLEKVLPTVINSLSPEDLVDVVAILDPPRAGVHVNVIKWIRNTPAIRRVIYISCDQRALERDCPGFVKSATKSYGGAPFRISRAFGVDLFPHTPHVEMVVVLERGEDVVAASCSSEGCVPSEVEA